MIRENLAACKLPFGANVLPFRATNAAFETVVTIIMTKIGTQWLF